MSAHLPEPPGSALSWVLNYCNIPHTQLEPNRQYSLSEISNNCRSSSATFLRCHLPNKQLREKLKHVTAELAKGDYMIVGRKGKDVKVGLMQKSDHVFFHIDKRVELLGDGVYDKKHPLEKEFDHVDIVYFLCAKFDEAHLIRPFLYRRRKARQLKKAIDKRNAANKKQSSKEKRRVREKKHDENKTKTEQKNKKKTNKKDL